MSSTQRKPSRPVTSSTTSTQPIQTSMSSPAPTTTTTPLLPTTLEAALLTVYPLILILGSVFSLIDPATRASHYSPTAQAHTGEPIPSYFARKSNLFNQIFVKRGWLWITLSYLFFNLTHSSTGPRNSLILTPKRLQGLIRWAMVTLWWIFVTQWFFGPALIDRTFTLSGGACEVLRQDDIGKIELGHNARYITGVACKASGGKWKGGHDISGHVFLLVLGSMFLLEEVLHVVARAGRAKEERKIVMDDGAVKSAGVEAVGGQAQQNEGDAVVWDFGVKAALGVAGLSGWMLLMTAAYFHTWFEKFTGLFVAYVGIFTIYFLPRIFPALRRIIGVPGI